MHVNMVLGVLGASLVAVYVGGALAVGRRDPLRRASFASALALLGSLVTIAVWIGGAGSAPTVVRASGLDAVAPVLPSLRFDAVTAVVLPLVALIGVVVTRYSRRYLDGAPGQPRYARAMLATLAAVVTLVLSNHLLWIGVAWVATSLALHQLLTFFRGRRRAQLAAQKKFVFSRIADLALAVAVGIVGVEVGSLQLDDVHAWAAGADALGAPMQVATCLFVVGAALKCAQLPFHGWLVQVMEAPTPVSALLHAGVVNIGGFLMIRLAPLMVLADVAQTALLLVGLTTTVLAALVTSTQSSVKVALAWSTAAQMGFMLVQCALGAYELALLHLVAHSLYKAHAFLSSGSAVEQQRIAALRTPGAAPGALAWTVALGAGVATVGGLALAFGVRPLAQPALLVFALVLAMAVTPLLLAERGRRALRAGTGALLAVGVVALYFGWHALFAQALAVPAATTAATWGRLGVAAAGFLALFGLQLALLARPNGAIARALEPRLTAGLYLDERLTQLLTKSGLRLGARADRLFQDDHLEAEGAR